MRKCDNQGDWGDVTFVDQNEFSLMSVSDKWRLVRDTQENLAKARALAQLYWIELALIKNHGSDDAKVLKARAAAALEET